MIRAMLQLQDETLQLVLFRWKGKCHILRISAESEASGVEASHLSTWCGRPNAAKERLQRRDYPCDEMCMRCLECLQVRCQERMHYTFYEKMTCDWCHAVILERHLLPDEEKMLVFDLCQQCYQEHPLRSAYRSLLYRAHDLYKELAGEECICYRYDPRDPGVCFLCFHTPLVDEGQKVGAVWHDWLEEAFQFLAEIEFLSAEEREQVAALKREAEALDTKHMHRNGDLSDVGTEDLSASG